MDGKEESTRRGRKELKDHGGGLGGVYCFFMLWDGNGGCSRKEWMEGRLDEAYHGSYFDVGGQSGRV